MEDTVFAPSTAIGGAITVIRISGEDVSVVIEKMIRKPLKPRELRYCLLKSDDTVLDACMAVWFPAPNSYTGEDMLELHCHGGIQTFRNVSNALLALNLRPAEGGEFTKRAFLNGKMDLTQAEAVMDIINAQADISLRAALNQLSGRLSGYISKLENELLDLRALVEATIDYPDEMEEDALPVLFERIDSIHTSITDLLERSSQAKFLREGIHVLILGKPNVGKSSLFNALIGEDRAIVTRNAGTTRDLLDEHVAWNGVSVHLTDTAGMRNAEDEAEIIGIERARKALETADLILLVVDGSGMLTEEDHELFQITQGMNRVILLNKSDLPVSENTLACCETLGSELMRISCATNDGLAALKDRIVSVAEPDRMDPTCVTNVRHIRALEASKAALARIQPGLDLDCVATELREASHQLGTITGSDVDEKLLDRIFENFCVGK